MQLSPRARRAVALSAWLVATVLVVLALRAVGWERTLHAVRRASPPWVLAAMACHLMIIVLWAWQTLLLLPRGVRVPYGRMFEVQALTTTASNTIPAFLGQATGVALLAERGGVGSAVALSAFALHNVVEGVAKLASLYVATQVAPLPPWMHRAVALLAVGTVALVAGLAVASWSARRRAAVAPAGERRDAGLVARLRAFAVRWAASLDALRSPGRLAMAVLVALLMKTAETGGWWCVERAFGIAPRPGSAVLALVATNLASAIPASPGNLGVYEGAAYLVYATLGVPRETAFAVALVGHLAYLVPLVGAGWVLLTVQQLRARLTAGSPASPSGPPPGRG